MLNTHFVRCTGIRRAVPAAALALVCLLAVPSRAAESAAPSPTQAAFDRLKALAGDWQGKAGGEMDVQVTYRLTSGGSVVLETLFPGTPHEMLTVYYLEGDKLVLVHYCAVKNQPRMELSPKSTATDLRFDFAGGSNLDPARDGHMHSARFQFQDKDRITCEWDYYKEGKKADTKKFTLTRK